jgi:hypothetical protein
MEFVERADLFSSTVRMKLKERKHRLVYHKIDEGMDAALTRYRECKDKKPKDQVKREMKICKDYWGCYPLHYYRYDLFKKEKVLTDDELINYIPEFFFYKLFLDYYDTKKYSILVEDKNITQLFFKSLNISQPITVFKIISGQYFDENMKFLPENEIIDQIKAQRAEKLFVKPADGRGGKGIYIFTKNIRNSYITQMGETLDKKFIDKIKIRDYIVQEGILQHGAISQIYPLSINTIRIATENIKGKVRIICAVIRIGRNGKEVDNCSQGGLAYGINIDTGVTFDYAASELGEKYYKHPNTKFIFKDFAVPEWEAIKAFTIKSAEKLPNLVYLGWDIALTEKGPLAIESNMRFGLDLYQVALGGLRKNFNISKPGDYWEKAEKRMGV